MLNRRQILRAGIAAGVTTSIMPRSLQAANANDEINVGFISCGGRAQGLMRGFDDVPGVNVAGLCDADKKRVDETAKRFPKAKTWTDLHDLIADQSIDAVVIATCNHWHCLAAIMAMEAGKDVYVEKPLSHSQWEGLQTVAAARKYNRICQVGTQQRSDPMQAEIKDFLHKEKALGEIVSARVNRYGIRRPIGLRSTPLKIDKSVAYDLWLGPAQDEPILRDNLHYDWHWDYNTGSGEMGNWGVHVLDDLRNNVLQDAVALPKRIFGGGGRLGPNDAGNTPNVNFVYFDTGIVPVVIGLTGLPSEPNGKSSPKHPGPGSGYIAYCEGGRFEGQRGRGQAFDNDGKLIKSFKGNQGSGHIANFIEAVRKQDRSILNAEVEVGNDSTGWCNVANIAYRSGAPYTVADANELQLDVWQSLLGEMKTHLAKNNIKMTDEQVRLSPMLDLDSETEQFVGENAKLANSLLKREYRSGFEVPQIV